MDVTGGRDFNQSDEDGNHSASDFMEMGGKERVILTVDYHFQKFGSETPRNCGSEKKDVGFMECWGFAYLFFFFKMNSWSHL